HREETRRGPYDRLRETFRLGPQGAVRLAQPYQLALQLVLELAAQMVALDPDAGPRIAPGEHPVRLAHVLVLDRERVRRLAPFPLREDERSRVTGSRPGAHHRRQGVEQRSVHRVADEQRV